MNAPEPSSAFSTIRELNKTPLNLHVLSLFSREKVRPAENRLALVALARWAEDNLTQVEPHWLEQVVAALVVAEMDNPEALESHLQEATEIADADDLEEAAMLLLQHLADWFPQAR